MEVLATELAEILNITVDKAIELYPVLRSQFINYRIVTSIENIFSWGAIISFIIMIIAGITLFAHSHYLDTNESYFKAEKLQALYSKKITINSLKIFIATLVASNLLSILKYTLAPDFMIIKEFIM